MQAVTIMGEFIRLRFSQQERAALKRALEIILRARDYYEDEDPDGDELRRAEVGLTEILEQSKE